MMMMMMTSIEECARVRVCVGLLLVGCCDFKISIELEVFRKIIIKRYKNRTFRLARETSRENLSNVYT